MKSSFELAMERLNKTAPTVKVSAAVKKELAELDSKYAAKIAEREIALNGELARVANDPEKAQAVRNQLTQERKNSKPSWKTKKTGCGRRENRIRRPTPMPLSEPNSDQPISPEILAQIAGRDLLIK